MPTAIWYSKNSEVVERKGIKITTQNPVAVQATHFRLYFTDATGILPKSALGDEYYVTCYYKTSSPYPTSFVVVATEDDTQLEITPTAFTLGLLHPSTKNEEKSA